VSLAPGTRPAQLTSSDRAGPARARDAAGARCSAARNAKDTLEMSAAHDHPSVDSRARDGGSMTRRWGRAEAVLAPKTGRSSGERATGGATPAASPVAPRSSPMRRAATIGSTQPGTHDRPASDTAEATGAAAPPARVAARGSLAPSTDPTGPPARRAQAGSAPPSTRATTANDPPSPSPPERRT
jgi:hypothetical protein